MRTFGEFAGSVRPRRVPVEAGLPFLWILHDLVDEIAKVQDEIELILGPRPLILEDHAAIAVELAFVDVLAAYERELHRPGIVWQGAVMVRPMRLPLPLASVKRYQ